MHHALTIGLSVGSIIILLIVLWRMTHKRDEGVMLTTSSPSTPVKTTVTGGNTDIVETADVEPEQPDNDLRERIETATTLTDLAAIYYDATGTEFESLAANKLASTARAELELATTFDGCWTIYSYLPIDPSPVLAALERPLVEKMLAVSTTTEEAMSVLGDVREHLGEEEVNQVLRRGLELASTVEDAQQVLDATDSATDLEYEAAVKLLDLVDTVEECETVWTNFGTDTDIGRLALLRVGDIIRDEDAENEKEKEVVVH